MANMNEENCFAFNNDRDTKLIRYVIEKDFLRKKSAKKSQHGALWNSFAEDLATEYNWQNLTGKQLKNRWNQLVGDYNKKKDSMDRSGASGKHRDWVHWNDMNEAMSSTVQRDPLHEESSISAEASPTRGEGTHDADSSATSSLTDDNNQGNDPGQLQGDQQPSQQPESTAAEGTEPPEKVRRLADLTPKRVSVTDFRRGVLELMQYNQKVGTALEASLSASSGFLQTMNTYLQLKIAQMAQPSVNNPQFINNNPSMIPQSPRQYIPQSPQSQPQSAQQSLSQSPQSLTQSPQQSLQQSPQSQPQSPQLSQSQSPQSQPHSPQLSQSQSPQSQPQSPQQSQPHSPQLSQSQSPQSQPQSPQQSQPHSPQLSLSQSPQSLTQSPQQSQPHSLHLPASPAHNPDMQHSFGGQIAQGSYYNVPQSDDRNGQIQYSNGQLFRHLN